MDQKTRWNTAGGSAWVELQAVTDQALAPFIPPLVEGIGGAVLDVGCGTGATTEAAARHATRVVGVDISTPMVEAARARTDAAEFIVADAQTFDRSATGWSATTPEPPPVDVRDVVRESARTPEAPDQSG